MIGTCIQLGIKDSPEYLYLTQPNWQSHTHKRGKVRWGQIPKSITNIVTDWEYIGVDADIASITQMIDAHPTQRSRVNWICAALSDKPELVSVHSFYESSKKYQMQTTTLDSLLESIAPKEITVLAMDLDGWEHRIFQNFSFKWKPKFIALEMHLTNEISVRSTKRKTPDTEKTIDIFKENGYKIVYTSHELTNFGKQPSGDAHIFLEITP